MNILSHPEQDPSHEIELQEDIKRFIRAVDKLLRHGINEAIDLDDPLDDEVRRLRANTRVFRGELPEPMAFSESAAVLGVELRQYEITENRPISQYMDVTFHLVEPDEHGDDERVTLLYEMYYSPIQNAYTVARSRTPVGLVQLLEQQGVHASEAVDIISELQSLSDTSITAEELSARAFILGRIEEQFA